MVILLENDYLFYGGYSALQNFYLIISPIIIMEQKRKWSLGIRAIKAFEYENTSDVKMMQLLRKKKKFRLQLSVLGTQGTILETVTPDIDGFTDEPVVHQCDVQVVENNFIDDFE